MDETTVKVLKYENNELHDWLVKIQPTVIPELKLGKAINYALNSWEHILNYIECPEIYLDNSIAERSIKPFVLGRLAICRFRRWSSFKLPLVFFDRMC